MTRIGGSTPGHLHPQPMPSNEPLSALGKLPAELPECSHIKISSAELAKLFLPENVDLSRLPKDHPLHETLNRIWLEITLKAVVAGKNRSSMGPHPMPPGKQVEH